MTRNTHSPPIAPLGNVPVKENTCVINVIITNLAGRGATDFVGAL
jgi:hypothetical protein